ncbi:MAG TPA: hypothetical protein VFV57_05645 [Limnobacter sp.]|nr:hypothetical protein [Limnobacter sp.]
MIFLQVKAKSGLHAGASWRLDKSVITLGASAKADVFLCDAGMPDQLLTIRKVGRKYQLESAHGESRIRSGQSQESVDLILPSQMATLDFRQVQLEIQSVVEHYNIATLFGDRFARMSHELTRLLRNLGMRAWFGLLFLFSVMITATVVFFGTAGVVKSEASVLPHPQHDNNTLGAEPAVSPLEHHMANNVAQEMRDFAQRLQAKHFQVEIHGSSVSIDAMLSRAQTTLFERALVRQTMDYGQYVTIQAKLEFTEEQKIIDALDVERIVLGARPALILRDGTMLYIGGDFQGLEVVSIAPRKVILQGDTTYEVTL